MSDDEVPPGGRVVTEADIPWAAWTPWEAAERLRGVEVPWGVAGGWAIDLFLGAKAAREKDEADLAAVLPRLDGDRRAWLAAALDRAHPGHPWADRVRPRG